MADRSCPAARQDDRDLPAVASGVDRRRRVDGRRRMGPERAVLLQRQNGFRAAGLAVPLDDPLRRGPPPRAADRVSAADGWEGAVDLRAISRLAKLKSCAGGGA